MLNKKEVYGKKKIQLILKNLLIFTIVFILSLVLYTVSSSPMLINFFYLVSMVLGFVIVAFVIVLLVLLFLKLFRRK